MSQLVLKLQQVNQRLGGSSLLQVTAAFSNSSSSSCSFWTAAFWQPQQQQQQQQQQHPGLPQLGQLPQQLQQHAAAFSTCTAAADAAVLSLQTVSQLPCMLTNRVKTPLSRSSNTVQYPYPLPPQYTPRQWQLHSLDGRALAAVELPGDIFNVPVRVDILNQVVRWQRAKARQGTHKTKDRSEVSGGGKKPWPQKGSGRARHGSIRAPQWRGGGIVHGPVPRSHAFDLPRKVRRLGLKCALSAKANEGRLILVDSLQPHLPKTQVMIKQLTQLIHKQHSAAAAAAAAAATAAAGLAAEDQQVEIGLTGLVQQQQQQQEGVQPPPRISAVLIDSAKDGEDGGKLMRRAAGNLPGVEVVPAIGANVLSLLRRDYVIMTKPALDAVIARLQRPINRLGAAGLAFKQQLQQRRAAAAKQRLIEKRLSPATKELSNNQQQQQQQAFVGPQLQKLQQVQQMLQ